MHCEFFESYKTERTVFSTWEIKAIDRGPILNSVHTLKKIVWLHILKS